MTASPRRWIVRRDTPSAPPRKVASPRCTTILCSILSPRTKRAIFTVKLVGLIFFEPKTKIYGAFLQVALGEGLLFVCRRSGEVYCKVSVPMHSSSLVLSVCRHNYYI